MDAKNGPTIDTLDPLDQCPVTTIYWPQSGLPPPSINKCHQCCTPKDVYFVIGYLCPSTSITQVGQCNMIHKLVRRCSISVSIEPKNSSNSHKYNGTITVMIYWQHTDWPMGADYTDCGQSSNNNNQDRDTRSSHNFTSSRSLK